MGGCLKAQEPPRWHNDQVISSGADKDVLAGTYQNKRVAICIARRGGDCSRIQQEIKTFKILGKHPHIISMLYCGTYGGRIYLALEAIEPIGYDMSRLVNQYSWTGKPVPASLSAKLMLQLTNAVNHMHSKNILHRDLKTENVLITGSHDAKLIDMGIACEVGRVERLQSPYLAPELCEGHHPLTPKVDCWGIGLILHQVYQRRWDVLEIIKRSVRMRIGMPSKKLEMAPEMREAMESLLQLDPEQRWSLTQLQASQFIRQHQADYLDDDAPVNVVRKRPTFVRKPSRVLLRRFSGEQPPPTALAVEIGKSMREVVGKRLADLQLGAKYGITVLLVGSKAGAFETVPNADMTLELGGWLYLGIPQGEGMEVAFDRVSALMFPDTDMSIASSRTIAKLGKLLAYTLEFDCFEFPEHIGEKAVLGSQGPSGELGLNMRGVFGINIAGIQRVDGSEPEFYPTASAVVRPGDLGLVVRLPCPDGSTESTVEDLHLADFMDDVKFREKLGLAL